MSKVLIEVKNLTKYYRIKKDINPIRNILFPVYTDFLAINNISFKVMKNEIFGILGPNGAGKTTIVKILCGLLSPTSGTIIIDNKDVSKNFFRIQTITGTMFGNTLIYHRLSGYDNLKYYCRVYDIPNYKERIIELLNLVDLVDWKDQLVENYSLGMKSKLALARALVHNPDIIILDEPTLGLDPKNSMFIRNLLNNLGKTIVITTHNMDVANDVCTRIAFLRKGHIITIDTPENLKLGALLNLILEIETPEVEELNNQLKSSGFTEKIERINKYKLKIYLKSQDYLPNILEILSTRKISNIKTITPSLEEAFLKFTSAREQK
ncbi:MAG: ABC transporter ATP-binding protein [Candidatus Helarchaeota archaeon]|nr:ABC transporter ATP-binding protein [Candidatus Helarchaeota archaeon]